MKKRKYLEKLNLAFAAALILGSTGSLSFAKDSSLRGAVLDDVRCNSDSQGQADTQDGNQGCVFPTGSEGVAG